ncbi:VOC family protein [Streptomyces sp. M10(2022)]
MICGTGEIQRPDATRPSASPTHLTQLLDLRGNGPPGLSVSSTRQYGDRMTSIKKFQVTFDCAEPERLARFWCEVLGYVVPPPPEGLPLGAISSARSHLSSGIRGSPAVIPQVWARDCTSSASPKEGRQNRLHLDVRVGTGLVGKERLAALETECARLVPLGAVHVRTLYDGNDSCIPMQDIEGNEFCID